MTILPLVVAAALPTAAAYLIVGRIWAEPERDLASRLVRAGLAPPLALGSASLFTYAWLMGGGTLGTAYAIADLLVFAGLLGAAWRWRARRTPERGGARPGVLDRAAIAAAAVALAAVAARFVQATAVRPHGGWDAWAIWNMRARFLFRAGEHWRLGFAPELGYSHTDYPLLLPSIVARLWAYSGETPAAPALAAAIFTFAPPLVILGAVARRAGWLAGATASLLVIAARSWIDWGPSQYADVPVACFVAAAVAAVLAATRRDGSDARGMYGLAGALLALSAWTKDEGLLLAAVFGAWAVLAPASGSRRARAAALATGAGLPLAVRASFQLALAPGFGSTFASGQSPTSVLERLLSSDRWSLILAEIPRFVPGAEVGLPAVAVIAALLLGARWRGFRSSPAIPALGAAAGFLLVYAVTPLDLQWHVTSSADRVLLQPWPAFVAGLFLLAPREARAGVSLPPARDAAGQGGPGEGAGALQDALRSRRRASAHDGRVRDR